MTFRGLFSINSSQGLADISFSVFLVENFRSGCIDIIHMLFLKALVAFSMCELTIYIANCMNAGVHFVSFF